MTGLLAPAVATRVNPGDTAWMLAATALVLMMTPALGLFYAGLVRSKNTLNTFMMCVAALARRHRHVGARRLLARLRRGQRVHRRPRARLPARRHLHAPRRDGDPAAAVHGLPGDLLHRHGRARVRRRRRADALRAVPGLRRALVGARLRGAGPLGVRRRLVAGPRHARLRGRRAGGDGIRLLGAGRRARRRRAQGLRAPGATAAQRRLRAARRRPAVVRLVRVQRRQRLLDRATRACSRSRTRC